MTRRWLAGRPLTPEILGQIGFDYVGSDGGSVESWCLAAKAVLRKWNATRSELLQQVCRVSPEFPPPVWKTEEAVSYRTRAKLLVEAVYRAGLRAWFGTFLIDHQAPATVADLQSLCSLLRDALDLCKEAYPVYLCAFQSPGERSLVFRHLDDRYLLSDCYLWLQTALLAPSLTPEVYERLANVSFYLPFPAEDSLPYTEQDLEDHYALYNYYAHYVEEEEFTLPATPPLSFWVEKVRQCRSSMRQIAPQSPVPFPGRPKQFTTNGDCKRHLSEIVNWCSRQMGVDSREDRGGSVASPTAESNSGQGQNPQANHSEVEKPKRRWTQAEVDAAIRAFKEEHASVYEKLRAGVASGWVTSERKARQLFGRNSLAKRLDVRSSAMISNSEVWRAIAEELGLEGRRKGELKRQPAPQDVYEAALEAKAVMNQTHDSPADQADVAELEEQLKKLPAKFQEEIRGNVDAGINTLEEALEISALVREGQSEELEQKRRRKYYRPSRDDQDARRRA
jgi:hypothetical protein